MVSLQSFEEKFFAIYPRTNMESGKCIFVPQNIFPKSKIIDMIKQQPPLQLPQQPSQQPSQQLSQQPIPESSVQLSRPLQLTRLLQSFKPRNHKKSRVEYRSFYINREYQDMKNVVNYLSGQSYDISKSDLIREILLDDFDIDIDVDIRIDIDTEYDHKHEKTDKCHRGKNDIREFHKHDHKHAQVKFSRDEITSTLGCLWNDIKKEFGFLIHLNGEYSFHLDSNMCEFIVPNYDHYDLGRSGYIHFGLNHCIDDIMNKYSSIARSCEIDIIEYIRTKILKKYPFIKDISGKTVPLTFRVFDHDIHKLNLIIRKLEVSRDKKRSIIYF
jgi:hypothetical protein